ncbi:hypothetical protein KA005_12770 [bacterium]|nr:hypothetical protein [bacterium]
MIDLIKELKSVMEEKKFKGTTAAKFINCSARQVYRWIKSEHIPTAISREAIKRGIRRMKRL